MTEEIKEIEQYLKKCSNCFTCNNFLGEDENGGHCMLQNAYNYITNLQKENQSLKEKLNCKEYFSSTMPENTEFVILTKENYDRQQKDLTLENIILKSRNEKASAFLKHLKNTFDESDEMYDLLNNAIDTLEGGDE